MASLGRTGPTASLFVLPSSLAEFLKIELRSPFLVSI